MMMSIVPTTFALSLLLCAQSLAVPQGSDPAGLAILLKRRARTSMSFEEIGIWAKTHRENLETKYGSRKLHKRASGTNLIVNQNQDSSYFGSLAIGTPPTAFNVILDTGSADLWVAGSSCSTGCSNVQAFNPSNSSTFQNSSTSFSITYGSGEAAGSLGSDVVQMAGFTVKNQVFAICDTVSSGLLTTPVSGLLGLGFQSISTSKATPFWQALVGGGVWDSPVMGFQLSRFLNDTSAAAEEAGGSFTMGFTNSSLYTGDIDYVNMPVQGSYWILSMTAVNVNGNSIPIASGQASYAAIDTGTTLVGGPPQVVSQIFAQIPGSQPGTGNFENYFTYPCDSAVDISLSFGGRQNWTISAADFQLQRLSRSSCLGALFQLSSGGSAPAWIVGDTFLKNVYSVFRYQPPSVGFAQLSSTAVAENSSNRPVPTPTIGSAAAVISATSLSGKHESKAVSLRSQSSKASIFAAIVAVSVERLISASS